MYSALLSCVLKMVKMVKFMLCVFYHNWDKKEEIRS